MLLAKHIRPLLCVRATTKSRLKMNGTKLILAERQRQIDIEGWTDSHDDDHGSSVLENAAYCYRDAEGPDAPMPNEWPWSAQWWKPKDRKRNLERAGALYLAASATSERARDFEARDRLNQQFESCAIRLSSILNG